MTTTITEQELAEARKIWGDALVAVSKAYEDDGIEAATEVANGALDAAYGYNLGEVLFKPTLASGEQTFRTTREGALLYFVGHDDNYPFDGAFTRADRGGKSGAARCVVCPVRLSCSPSSFRPS